MVDFLYGEGHDSHSPLTSQFAHIRAGELVTNVHGSEVNLENDTGREIYHTIMVFLSTCTNVI